MPLVSLLFHDVYRRDPRESGFVSAAADRYKLSIEEFDAQLAGLALVDDRADFLITVDDGGLSYYTVIADRLEALGRRGHCFVSTGYIGRRGFLDAAQLRALHARRHVIGSHSATHPSRFSALGYQQMCDEWRRSRQALEDLLGDEVPTVPTAGRHSATWGQPRLTEYLRWKAIARKDISWRVSTDVPPLRSTLDRDLAGRDNGAASNALGRTLQ